MRRDQVIRPAAAALGWTTIVTASITSPLMDGDHMSVYHWGGHAFSLFAPVLAVFGLIWLALALMLLSAGSPGRWRVAVWAGLVLITPRILLNATKLLWPLDVPAWVRLPALPWVAAAWVVLVLIWRPANDAYFERGIRWASTLLGFVGVSGALLLVELGWGAWAARGINSPLPLHHPAAAAQARTTAGPRIIWIVFDELSEGQVFERRVPGLALPTFDSLAQQSTVFSHVDPAGTYTERVLPSLFTGRAFGEVRATLTGRLLVPSGRRNQWGSFDQYDTVFRDALDAGYRTAVVGWYNPYCRILPGVLDRCYWSHDIGVTGVATSNGSFKQNFETAALRIIRTGTMGRLLRRNLTDLPVEDPTAHVADFEKLSAAADQQLKDRSDDFVLIHLPIPHPEGIYNRATGQLTTEPSTYIDNLALTDKVLAHIRSLLEAEGEWDSSMVVVMGDHGWRVKTIWRNDPTWTAEEERASMWVKHPKPAYIVKMPGQKTGSRIDTPFPAVRTRALLDRVMAGNIRTPEDLAAFARSGISEFAEASSAAVTTSHSMDDTAAR